MLLNLLLGSTLTLAHPLNTSLASGIGTWGPGSGPFANPGSIYLCRGPDWTGECTYSKNPLVGNKGGPPCITIPKEWRVIQSIGGDEGPECFSHADDGCTGIAMDITYPGVPNTHKIVLWRDWLPGRATSYRCQFGFYPDAPPP